MLPDYQPSSLPVSLCLQMGCLEGAPTLAQGLPKGPYQFRNRDCDEGRESHLLLCCCSPLLNPVISPSSPDDTVWSSISHLPLCPADASPGRWGRRKGAQPPAGREGDKASFLPSPTGARNPEALPKCGEIDCQLKCGDCRGKKNR